MVTQNEPEKSRGDWLLEVMFVIVTATPWILMIWVLWPRQ